MAIETEAIGLGIIGAGWAGLTAAKTFLEVHPDVDLVLFEASDTLGGTWSQDRLYPGVRTNNLLGTYQSPDFPMDTETFGVRPGEHIPGQTMHQYLTKFAQRFGVYDRIRFGTKVEGVEDAGDGWILNTSCAGKNSRVHAKKLLIAAGVTNQPNIPKIPNAETFGAPLFHAKSFLQHADLLESAKRVTVLGGAKTAWDVAYAFGKAGVKVDMVIRESGKGPVWMTPAYVTPLKKWLEKLLFVRFLTWFSPCIWGAADGFGFIRRLIHNTFIGRAWCRVHWWILNNDLLTLNEFDKHPERKMLQPWQSSFWIGNGLSILNYPTPFYDLVRDGLITVHHSDITELSPHKVHLSSGEILTTDALIYATGWRHGSPVPFADPNLPAALGLPYYSPTTPPLTEDVDKEIFTQFPRLKEQDNMFPKNKLRTGKPPAAPGANQPYKLYRFVIPPNSDFIRRRDFGVVNAMGTLNPAIVTQAQSLWFVAYFDGKLDLATDSANGNALSDEDIRRVKWETELWSRFGKWRIPAGAGDRYPDMAWDTLPYVDVLLKDLGLKIRRKGSWLKEVFEPYGPEDYKGLVGEWLAKETENGRDVKKNI